ncbi:MAG: peptide-methionine (R)-S-oxide reductase MsrB [Flavobacteriaceae bacterium]|nr:MAG: peptide-methionine (R)-S-oxide reductase MsrB [Flavobacteriaceae bacterium]
MKTLMVLLLFLSGTTLTAQEKKSMERKVIKSEEEWKEVLTPQQYYVLREKGTDRPGDGGYTKHFEKGTYHCAACDAQLFESGTKYESHCGWPSFDDAIKGSVEYVLDKSHGMLRTEIICTSCGGHLGHVFDDGPRDTTGKRYCVNTSSIRFEKSDI